MNRKYVFFDIDNTLAVGTPGRQYVPESAAEAVKFVIIPVRTVLSGRGGEA